MSHLINDIATSLSEYGSSRGYSLPFSYYRKLAWGGLTQYRDINGLVQFYDFFILAVPDENERFEILSIIEAEATNSTVGNYIPKGIQPNSQVPCD